MHSRILLVTALAAALMHAGPADGARILAVFPFPSPSHMHVLSALTKGLAARGHQLVVASPVPLKNPVANYTDIDLMPSLMEIKKRMVGANLYEFNNLRFHAHCLMMWGMGLGTTEAVMTSPQFKNILKDKQGFDLVITESFMNEALYGVAHYFKAPLVVVCPFGGFHWHSYGFANPAPYSYVPNAMLEFSDRMTFYERLKNTIFTSAWNIGHYLYYLPRQDALVKKVFGDDFPSIHELESLPSLMLINQHFTLNYPRPMLPNILEVGGMHVSREVKPLDKGFKDFIDGAKEGVVYFSMGSNLRSDLMAPEKIKAFLEAFSELPQRVLWKWEADSLPGKSSNVKVAPWMPQQEILAHPNVKIFITHGGLLSAQEAAYHGKTLIGVPIFGDQMLNMKRAQLGGYAIYLDFNNITKTSVKWAIQEALSNKKIVEASKQRSLQYRDQPHTPLEKAIFWTEYVLRHKGAKHMKSAGADLKWFQLSLLDVYAVIFAPFLIFLWLCKKCCCGKKTSPTTKSQNKSKKNN